MTKFIWPFNPVTNPAEQPVSVDATEKDEIIAVETMEITPVITPEITPPAAIVPQKLPYFDLKTNLFYIPRVIVSKQVLIEMQKEVLAHPHIETSWGLYGLRDENDGVLIAGILLPDGSTRREVGNTTFGDESFAQQMRWLEANYTAMQKRGLVPPGYRFEFLFKGHSHHTLNMREYSGTDIASILDAITMGMEIAIGPLANIDRYNEPRITQSREIGTLKLSNHTEVSFKFYYYSQGLAAIGRKLPVTVTPEVVTNVPKIPSLSWEFLQPDYFKRQIRLLEEHGCKVETSWRVVDTPPLKIFFTITKEGWKNSLQIITNHDHPRTMPQFQIPESKSIIPVSIWSFRAGNRDLVDTVKELERFRRL